MWRLFVAVGFALLWVLGIVLIFVLKNDSEPANVPKNKDELIVPALRGARDFMDNYRLGIIAVSGLVSLAVIVSSLWGLVFFKVNTDRTEQAIAERFYKQIDREAEAGLSSKKFKELQPQQIEGTPAKAGPKSPGKPYRR